MKDVGLEALDLALRTLQPDGRWLRRDGRKFSWLPFRLTQTVAASPVFQEAGLHLSRLTARTVVAEDVTAPPSVAYRVLSNLNRHALGSSYCFRPHKRRIEATTVAFVHADTLDWRALQFTGFAMLQLGMTHAEAPYIADKCGATVPVAPASEHGYPAVPDLFVDSIDKQWASVGRQASRFCDADEFGTIEHTVRHSARAATLGATTSGIAIEFPFAGETSLARLDVEEPHRRIGNGLLVRLFLPTTGSTGELLERANALNEAEALGGAETMHYGAWCLAASPTGDQARRFLQYQAFLPNAFHRVGIAQDAANSVARRAEWADWGVNGRSSATDPRAVMLRNMRNRLELESSDET